MTKEETIKKIAEKVEGMRSCMFVTVAEDGSMAARPMGLQEAEFDGSFWFMTDKRSRKVKELQANPAVGLEFAHSNGVTFVSLSGNATFSEDRARIQEYWNPFLKAWFEGPEDENITLIEVKVARGAYWDNKGGKLGALADMAIGAVTGNTNTLDEYETFSL